MWMLYFHPCTYGCITRRDEWTGTATQPELIHRRHRPDVKVRTGDLKGTCVLESKTLTKTIAYQPSDNSGRSRWEVPEEPAPDIPPH